MSRKFPVITPIKPVAAPAEPDAVLETDTPLASVDQALLAETAYIPAVDAAAKKRAAASADIADWANSMATNFLVDAAAAGRRATAASEAVACADVEIAALERETEELEAGLATILAEELPVTTTGTADALAFLRNADAVEGRLRAVLDTLGSSSVGAVAAAAAEARAVRAALRATRSALSAALD